MGLNVLVCLCVLMCVCVSICVSVCVYKHMYVCLCICVCLCVYSLHTMNTYKCIYTGIHVNTCMYMYVHITSLHHHFIDIDECANNTVNICEQKCINTQGSFMCACNSGFELNSDETTCRGKYKLLLTVFV